MSKSFNAKYDEYNPYRKHNDKKRKSMTPYNRSKQKMNKS